MPIIVECDGGCGATANGLDEFKRFGYFVGRYYCEECAASVQGFLDKRDRLHDKVAESWQDGLEKLEAKWQDENPKGTLPQ